MVELIIKENEAGQRLDKYLHKYMKEAGSGFLYKMLRKKNITLNGKKAEGSEKLCKGDYVKLFLADETVEKFGGRLPAGKGQETSGKFLKNDRGGQSEKDSQQMLQAAGTGHTDSRIGILQYRRAYEGIGKLEIVYEDHHVLILNKPSGILTQKAAPEDISLNEWLTGYLLEKGELAEEELHTFRPSVCNRLDRNTSGMVICGKTLAGSQKMSELLRERSLHKYYHLYVKGRVAGASSAEGYLVKEERANRVRLAERGERAAYIRTNYKPLEYFGDLTLVEAELVTGKPHQIRLHLAASGHPVLGDYKYGEKAFNDIYKKKYGVKSQLLHACRLEFPLMEGRFRDLSGLVLTAGEPGIFKKIQEGERDRERK